MVRFKEGELCPDGMCGCCMRTVDLLELVDNEQIRVRSLSADIDRYQHNLEVALNKVRELEKIVQANSMDAHAWRRRNSG